MSEENQSTAQEDKKNDHINLKVVDAAQNEVHFKIKKSTPLKKLMEAYCAKQNKQLGSLRFLFDGTRLLPTATPSELGMEDKDTIDVMVEQYGGGFC